MDVSKVDKNFSNYYSTEGMNTYNVNSKQFKLYGLYRDTNEYDFKRLPHFFVEKTNNQSIKTLYKNTSGIRVKFKTDSRRIILKCILPNVSEIPHMPLTGSSCFDLYADGHYCNVFRPGIDIKGEYSDNIMEQDGYCSGYTFPDKQMREILIHFPLYNEVSEVYIALEENAEIVKADDYAIFKPIIFYGSSITQGACASHPGNCYPAIISRWLDCDYTNLGFSGGCFAELEMSEYISSLEKSIFVYDYDHNAPTLECLESTHERFFREIRKNNPDLPVIFVSASDFYCGREMREKRKKVIKRTYDNAIAEEDDNVYFIDGTDIYSKVGVDYCTVDDTHPNDLGFYCMAKAISKVIKEIISKSEKNR